MGSTRPCYLRAMPKDRVRQFHLAGHSDIGGHLIDTHDHPIAAPVWDLYREAVAHFGAVPTMIERDDNIPGLERTGRRTRHRARARRAVEALRGGLMQLRELQQELQRDLLGEASTHPRGHRRRAAAAARSRLGIYRNAYRVRLIDALDDTYSVLHKLLGDETFVALGEMFIAAHPSVHRSIRWYGRELADFLSAAPALLPNSRFCRKSRASNGRWRRCSTRPDAAALERAALERRRPAMPGPSSVSLSPLASPPATWRGTR